MVPEIYRVELIPPNRNVTLVPIEEFPTTRKEIGEREPRANWKEWNLTMRARKIVMVGIPKVGTATKDKLR